jgi:hypothetical protein
VRVRSGASSRGGGACPPPPPTRRGPVRLGAGLLEAPVGRRVAAAAAAGPARVFEECLPTSRRATAAAGDRDAEE